MWHMIPGMSTRICDMALWNISGTLEIPNGSRLKQYLPNGVMNVVSSCESGWRGNCQNPLAASSFVNILLRPKSARL